MTTAYEHVRANRVAEGLLEVDPKTGKRLPPEHIDVARTRAAEMAAGERYVDPSTGRTWTAGSGIPIGAAVPEVDYRRHKGNEEEHRQERAVAAQSRNDSTEALRDHHAREAEALATFTSIIAEAFGCPGLDSDQGRSKMRPAFGDARSLARYFGASGAVRRPTIPAVAVPARGRNGRFTRAG